MKEDVQGAEVPCQGTSVHWHDHREQDRECCQYANNSGVHGTLSMMISDAFMAIHPTKINSFSVFSRDY